MIETTEEHPFFVEGQGWIFAGKIKTGDIVRLASGDNAKIENVERIHLDKPIKVYNIEVEGYHTYYVSELEILVHNKAQIRGPKNPEIIKDSFLKNNGIDAHQFKKDWLAEAFPLLWTVKDTNNRVKRRLARECIGLGSNLIEKTFFKLIRGAPSDGRMRAHIVVKGLDVSENLTLRMAP